MPRQIQGSQRDFSSGEIDVSLKRSDDHPARKTGLRQMSNARILNSGAVQNRPGRRAIMPFQNGSRTEEVTMSPGNTFKFVFGDHLLGIYSADGQGLISIPVQGNGAAVPWTNATRKDVVYAQLGLKVYVTFPGMIPQVLTWDGVTPASWTIADFSELMNANQKRTPFYRISPQGITLLPTQRTGAGVNLFASAALFVAGHVGTRMRFVGRQMLITAVTSSQLAVVTIEESLPGHQDLAVATDPRASFSIGDVVIGGTSGSKGIVTAISAIAIDVQLITTSSTSVSISGALPPGGSAQVETVSFVTGETVVGPAGSIVVGAAGAIDNPTIGVTLWDEEVMNAYRGYPASVFSDQFRVGFCDFPSVPGGIAWSAINSPTDLYVGPNPADAIFEIAPDKVRVYYVVPGPESSEFVFCDRKLYYIKIDASNPLKPGSVGFQTLSSDGCAQVQPRVSQEIILYVNAGQNSVMAVIASGAYYRPFNTKNLSDFHSHLFSNIIAIAVPTADGTFNERYAYVLNADGSMAVGKYTLQGVQSDQAVGWGPWSGVGAVTWISASAADVLFTASYFNNAICEVLDDTLYLDAGFPINNPPLSFAPPVGKGPMWWAADPVSLMDQGTRMMGTYQVDVNGFIIPQFNGGEDLNVASLVAGQPWTMTVEPFAPAAQSGVDMHQRMMKRRISNFAVHVVNSTGFTLQKLFSRKETATSPPLGTPMSIKRVPAWNQDDDATKPPKQRETVESWRPSGHSFDPRVAFIKDTPGPETIVEFGMEVSL
jgi:hypothetical protein